MALYKDDTYKNKEGAKKMEKPNERSQEVIEALEELAKGAQDLEDGQCEDCSTCEDFTGCMLSLRKAVGYMAEVLARIIESNQRVNRLISLYMKQTKAEDLQSEDFNTFYT